MDTNIVLARFTPRDPLRLAAKSFFDSKDERIVSPISLLEMSAVLSRGESKYDAPDFLARVGEARRVVALSEYFVEFLGLRVESFSVTSSVRVGGSTLSLPLEYSEALKNAGELRLRTLDLLHLVYAALVSSLKAKIDRFVTSDKGIIERSRIIGDRFGFRVVHLLDAVDQSLRVPKPMLGGDRQRKL